jgi:hypothetical protein
MQDVAAHVPEGRMAEVMSESEGLAEVLVGAQRTSKCARNLAHFQTVRQSRAVVVARIREKHLRLTHKPPERSAVQNAITVALELRTQRVRRLGNAAPAGISGMAGPRRKLGRFALF